MRAIVRAARAEVRALFGDSQVRSILLVSLVIYALIYPLPYRAEVLRDVPVVLVDLDRTPGSADLARRVDASEAVAISRGARDMAQAVELVQDRAAYGVLLIPEGFERNLLRGRQSPVAVYADASYFLMYQRVMQGAAVPIRQMGAEVEAGRLIAAGVGLGVARAQVSPATQVEVPLFNPAAGYATYVLPAAFVLILQQTLLMGLALTATRRRRGMDHPVWLILGRMAAWVAIYAVLLPIYLIVLPALFGPSFWRRVCWPNAWLPCSDPTRWFRSCCWRWGCHFSFYPALPGRSKPFPPCSTPWHSLCRRHPRSTVWFASARWAHGCRMWR